MKTYTLILFFLAIIFASSAQKKELNLNDCILIGIQNNLELKVAHLNTLQAKKQRFTYANSILPKVSLFGSHQYNFGSTIDPTTNSRVSRNFLQDNLNLNATSNILNIKNLYNAQSSKLNLEKVKANKKLIEYNYKLAITEAFYNTLFIQELLTIQEKQLQNTIKTLQRIKNEVQIGNKPKSDLYDITLSYTQEEKRVLESKQNVQLKIQELANLLNLKNTNILLIDNVNFTESIYQTSNNPELFLANINQKISERNFKAQKSNLLPNFSLFYNLSSFYYKPISGVITPVDNFKTQIQNNKNQQAGIQVSFTVFDGFRRNKKIAEAKIEKEKQAVLFSDIKNKIAQKVTLEELKKNQLEKLQHQLIMVNNNAKKSYTTAKAKFESGKIDLQVFNLSKNQLLNAEYDVLKNKLELNFIKQKLHFLYGND